MKRPLSGVLGGYAGGLLLGHFFQTSPALLWGLAATGALLALSLRRLRRFLLCPVLILAGWANLLTHTAVISPNDLRNLVGDETKQVTLRGVLAEPPALTVSEHKNIQKERSATALEVSGLRNPNIWQAAAGRVIIMAPTAPDDRFFEGQSVEVAGVIAPPTPPLAPGHLDYRDYLQTRNIYYQLNAKTNGWQLTAGAASSVPLTQRFSDWAKATLARGLPEVDEPLQLILMMALGWHSAFNGDVGDPFLQAGTMHLFAIDGLRIALVSGMLITLLRLLRLPRAVCGLVCLPLIWFYTAATGWEPSAIRASLMMTIIIAGWVLQRPGELVNSLCAAALIILIVDPPEMFEAGFQLSFLVVLIIALMLPPLNDWVNERLAFDPLVPAESIPAWRKWGVRVLRPVLLYLALSLTAWIGSIPLSAKYFNLFSPISPVANVVAVPLGMCTLMSIMGSLMCGAWCSWATVLFNHSAWFFMVALMRVSAWAAALPAAYFYVPAPPWVAIGIYYGALVAGLNNGLRVAKRKFALGVAVTGFTAALFLWFWESWRPGCQPTMTILSLSGSPVVFVNGPDIQKRILINCGDEDAVEGTLKPFLHTEGVNHLAKFVIATSDNAGCGGARHLEQLFGMDTLYTATNNFRSPAFRRFIAQFDQIPGRHKALRLNDTVAGWQVMHPGPKDNGQRAEDNALVLRGRVGHTMVILLGNLGRDAQNSLLSRTNDLHADLVVAGLPTHEEPLCAALLQAIHPQAAVIVDAKFPVSSRAKDALKARLTKTGIPVIYTRDAGAVTLADQPQNWQLSTMDGHQYTFAQAKE